MDRHSYVLDDFDFSTRMRRTPFFLRRRKGRAPEHGPFKFEELLPLQLKNQVSSKSSRGSGN